MDEEEYCLYSEDELHELPQQNFSQHDYQHIKRESDELVQSEQQEPNDQIQNIIKEEEK